MPRDIQYSDNFLKDLSDFCEERGYRLSNYNYSIHNEMQQINSLDRLNPMFVQGRQMVTIDVRIDGFGFNGTNYQDMFQMYNREQERKKKQEKESTGNTDFIL